ncbi:YIP1 family protein [Desulfoplanes sp.]
MRTETLPVQEMEHRDNDTTAHKQTYFQTVVGLITSPRVFFSGLPEDTGYKNGLVFLAISGIFWASLRFAYFSDHSLFQGVTLAVNAVGMPFVLAAFTFMTMGMFFGRLASYRQLVIIYAYATGTTMMVSWLPTTEIFTEPWRFILVAVGLVKWCSLKWMQAVVSIVLGVIVLLAMLASMAPVLVYLRQCLF